MYVLIFIFQRVRPRLDNIIYREIYITEQCYTDTYFVYFL